MILLEREVPQKNTKEEISEIGSELKLSEEAGLKVIPLICCSSDSQTMIFQKDQFKLLMCINLIHSFENNLSSCFIEYNIKEVIFE